MSQHSTASPVGAARASSPLRVLIVEDSEDDALLILRSLARYGYRPDFERVDNRPAMMEAVRRGPWDVVITDHNMPRFSSSEALEVVRASERDLPVMIVSGAIKDELAIAAMKAGAHDYIMKDNLSRLAPAIERELRAARTRRARRQAEQAVLHLVHRDTLTDLANRNEFEIRLRRLLQRAQQGAAEHVLAYIDLDQFKVVNDTCGHLAGDELLRQTSRILQGRLRRRDTLARLGGDEFGVLIEDSTLAHGARTAEELCRALAEYRFVWEERSYAVTASIGLVPIDRKSDSVVALMSAADAACYAAKDQGRNRVHVYHPQDRTVAGRHGEMEWVGRIHRALEEERLTLFYQPIAPIAPARNAEAGSGQRIELLLRMHDEDGQVVAPESFLPAAERYNIASRLDRWVVDTAFRWFQARSDRRAEIEYAAINLSGHSLGDRTVLQAICEKLDETSVPGEKLCFEITETAAIVNLAQAVQFMHALKSRGCRFALDDFGSGLSSFRYLKTMPVDFLKIDGLFVKDMVEDPIDLAMVRSINEIGHVMGKQTIAEFVESAAILSALADLGVDYAQGYAVGQPAALTRLG